MNSSIQSKTFLVRFDAETGKFVTELQKAERTAAQKFGDMGKSMSRLGKNMTKYLALPIAGFLGASAKMAMEFDRTLLRMVTLAGLTSEEVAAMRPEIIKTATQYGKSAQEAAEAMYFIASSGIKGSDAMEVLQKSLLSSALGMGETQVIADLLTSALNAYGTDVLSAGKATDYLMAAIAEGKAEPDQLAQSMGRVLPVASAMGVTFDQVAAGFAALSIGGTDASESATQLLGVMNTLNKPGKKAEKTLNAMGLSSEKLRKQLKDQGLIALLGTLREKFKGNTAAVASVFGNVRALNGVLALTGAKWQKSVEIFDNVVNASGLADRNKELLDASPGQKYAVAMEGFKNSMIGFGDAVAPEIETVTKAVTSLSNAMNSLSPSEKSFVTNAALITAAASLMVLAIGRVVTAMETLVALVTKYPAIARVFGLSAATVTVTQASESLNDNHRWYSKLFGALELLGPNPQNGLNKIFGKSPMSANDLAAKRYSAQIPRRAIGGTVNPGMSYLVGERGPELFSPTSSGFITPNGQVGAGSTPLNVTVNVHGSVIKERDLAVAVRDQIAQMMRRRGLDPSILGV